MTAREARAEASMRAREGNCGAERERESVVTRVVGQAIGMRWGARVEFPLRVRALGRGGG